MAVIQISKIQVRRGQKVPTGTVPQLSSAEFAWAVDSQELYIGNGSVAEGAPAVGNTKILTEHDNILELAASYQFDSVRRSIQDTLPRSISSKLDEYVSVLDFGAVGDGVTDCTPAFEAAIFQLFRNANTEYKKVLMIPNGTYRFASTLFIPATTILRGETRDGVKLNIGSNNVQFISSDGLTTYTDSTRPQNVQISNLTFQRTTGYINLTGVANSTFDNVIFLGNYVLSNTPVNLSTTNAAVEWTNTLYGTAVTGIKFNNCTFQETSIGVKCRQTLLTEIFATSVDFDNCKFFVNDTGIYIVGNAGQSNNWKITDSKFEEIANQAFRSTNGINTKFLRSEFVKCGGGRNESDTPTSVVVYFGEKTNNILVDCISDRQQATGSLVSFSQQGLSVAENSDRTNFVDRVNADITVTDAFRPLATFSGLNKYILIDYFLQLRDYSRIGQIIITIGNVLENTDDDIFGANVAITDNFQYSPLLVASPGGGIITNFEFAANLRSNDGASSFDTLVLSYKNPIGSVEGKVSYNVTYGV